MAVFANSGINSKVFLTQGVVIQRFISFISNLSKLPLANHLKGQ